MLQLTRRYFRVRPVLLLAALVALLAISSAFARGSSPLWIWIVASYAIAALVMAFSNARRRSEDTQKQERDRFFATSNDLLCIAGLDGYFRHVNPAFVSHSGFSLKELLTTPFISFVHPDHAAAASAAFARLAAGNPIERFECLCRQKDGAYHWLSWTATAVLEEGLIFAVARDTTARKELEQRLAHFSAIIESSRDAIFSLSRDGRIASWNSGAQRLFGYAESEVIGRRVSALAPPGRPEEQRRLMQCIECETMQCDECGERIQDVDAVQQRKDGSLVPIAWTLSPIRDSQGAVLGLSAIARDVTDRRRTEEALRESNAALTASIKQAEAASLAKSEFLANMSHEIRTPMTVILGYAELLSGDGKLVADSNKRQEALEAIKRNGQQLLEILDDILDLSKVEAGKLAVERFPCSPRQVVQEISELMQVRADEKGLKFESCCEASAPDFVETDPTRLRQILINTVGNAIKFTETGGVRLAVRGATTPQGAARVQFDISDTGIGMSEEQLAKLFLPFSQADASMTRKYGGTGLGLSICTRLVALLGGEIDVTSKQGEGSVFRISLPVGTPPEVETLPPSEEPAPLLPHGPEKPRAETLRPTARVLLAEDSPDNQRLIDLILGDAGIEVTIVEDGQAAVDKVLESMRSGEPFDAVLMDMQMPVLDGYTAARRLRDHGCTLPVVALTAHAMKGDREKCLAAGCDAYLTKPLDLSVLVEVILGFAKQRRAAATQSATSK